MAGVALDTNILVYAEGVERVADDTAKVLQSRRLMRRLADAEIRTVVAAQALAELHNVLVRRRRLSPSDASMAVRGWIERADVVATSVATLDAAFDLASAHGLPIFDAVILAAAVEGRCDLLLSEDFQDGFAWRGVVVTNPFGPAPDRRLARVLVDGA
ncbi:MAG: PIN domain-containing protein [Caulobacteraceae bacterium]